MENLDEQYIKGFNSGYVLSKHDPKLLEIILKMPNHSSDYIKGMQGGKGQYDREVLLEQLKTKQRSRSKDRSL